MTDIQKILAEYLDGSTSVENLLAKYNILPDSELAALLELARALEEMLLPIQPSPRFVGELRAELLGAADQHKLTQRLLRQLSATHLAAGIGGLTVAAGLLWFARKSALDIMRARRANMVS